MTWLVQSDDVTSVILLLPAVMVVGLVALVLTVTLLLYLKRLPLISTEVAVTLPMKKAVSVAESGTAVTVLIAFVVKEGKLVSMSKSPPARSSGSESQDTYGPIFPIKE